MDQAQSRHSSAQFHSLHKTLFDCADPRQISLTASRLARQASGKEELSNLFFGFMNSEQVLHVLKEMRCFGILALAAAALAAGSGPGWAFRLPDPNAAPLTEHQIQLRAAESTPRPYAMNYTDEAAQTLGVHNGKWEAFSTQSRDPLSPRFKGGIDGGRAMIGLQWRN
jgi:hypothetical protein